ncbi:alpha-tubulin suppressor-like RCC1 family protein [Cellulosimicrobium cellulans]|uniref:cell wall-binding repeat-containing protein n=1 Tax=Cellulosimicrobium cellulans TaxID=1710 RepID=UPI00195CA7CE|nr:cell wall-binding repeat-containing protein [Cellulosimicrobium cellulans]MBM7821208.1 alpha-tubulin suppressor-like RCC1 family protein [Cellulosimicrobium cellulans]
MPATAVAVPALAEVLGVPQISGGKIVVTGDPTKLEHGELDVPPLPEGLDYVDVDAGGQFVLALRSDGQAVAWGRDEGVRDIPALPEGLRYVDVAAGANWSLFLRSDGNLVGSGKYPADVEIPPLPAGVWYTQIDAHGVGSVALRSDGAVVAWGAAARVDVPALPEGVRYVDAKAGYFHNVALRSDGRVVGWGSGACGELDLPVAPVDAPYVELAAGWDATVALRADGELVVRACSDLISAPPAGPTATSLAVGQDRAVAVLEDGTLAQWGALAPAETPSVLPPADHFYVAAAVPPLDWAIPSFIAGLVAPHLPATRERVPSVPLSQGEAGVYVWGEQPGGELPRPLPPGVRYTDVSVSSRQVVLARSDGGATGYGDDKAGGSSIKPWRGGRVTEISAGETHAAYVTEAAGHAATTYLSVQNVRGNNPLSIGDTKVEAGDGVSLLLSSEGATDKGAVFVHGPSASSWLPLPEQPDRVPTVDVSLGARHALLARADGTVAGWGDPADGATAAQAPPTGQKFVRVAAGDGFSLALLSDGTIVGWGRNTYGQATPPAPPSGERFVAVDAGRDHAVALVSDGSVVAWGRDDSGQASLEGVPAGTPFSAVSAGGDTTAAVVGERADVELSAPSRWPAGDAIPLAADVRTGGAAAEGDVAFVVDGRTVAVVPLRDGTAVVRAWPVAPEAQGRSVQAVYLGAPGVAPLSVTADVAVGARSTSPSTTASSSSVDRLQGKDRYATAVAATSGLDPDIPVLYLASGETFADALSAAPAAAAGGGALLLTRRDGIPAEVEAEIRRLAPRRIMIVGGTGAVSEAVETRARTLAPVVWRSSGRDRYQTSLRVAEHAFGTQVGGVVVADGRSFPDALAAGAAAGAAGVPVILVSGNATTLDPLVGQALQTHGVRGVTVVGGSGAVSPSLERALRQVPGVVGTERLGGPDRYSTAVAINDAYFGGWHDQRVWSPPAANLATGSDFPDALAGAAAAGLRREPLYVVPSACVPGRTLDALRDTEVPLVRLLGGTGVLSPAVAALEPCA